jgi:hypothetical protein
LSTVILESFLLLVEDFITTNPVPVAYPSINFDPPDSGMWIEVSYFPNEPWDLTWGDDSCVRASGFFQVSIFYRPKIGQIVPSQLADSIIDFFKKGTVIGSVRVLKKPWQSPAVTESDKIFIPVTIPYSGLVK